MWGIMWVGRALIFEPPITLLILLVAGIATIRTYLRCRSMCRWPQMSDTNRPKTRPATYRRIIVRVRPGRSLCVPRRNYSAGFQVGIPGRDSNLGLHSPGSHPERDGICRAARKNPVPVCKGLPNGNPFKFLSLLGQLDSHVRRNAVHQRCGLAVSCADLRLMESIAVQTTQMSSEIEPAQQPAIPNNNAVT